MVDDHCVYFAARKQDLGIAGFGISVTTMEEVFIKVGEGTEETLERRCVLLCCTLYRCVTLLYDLCFPLRIERTFSNASQVAPPQEDTPPGILFHCILFGDRNTGRERKS